MKKVLFSTLAASTLLFAASCSQDDELVSGGSGSEETVTFTVNLPGATQTRAIADGVNVGEGNMATTLIWALYESGKDVCLDTGTGTYRGDGKFNATIDMVKGLNYNVLFLAYNAENCAFADVAEGNDLKSLTLKSELNANQEAYDAFVACHPHQVNAEAVTSVTLTRPFAQVNVATTPEDLEKADKLKAMPTNTNLVIEDVPTVYNVLTGEATTEGKVTYAAAPVLKNVAVTDGIANEDITVSDKTYKYLTMAYVLAGATADADKSMHNATFEFYRDEEPELVQTLNISNLPIQRNYRTNVIGNILTQGENFEIVIDAEFKGDHNVSTPWDGVTVSEPAQNADGAYMVATAEEWAWFANKTFAEDTEVEILGDIDMNGGDFMMTANSKVMTINGNGFTISNVNAVKSTSKNDNGGAASVSLFYPVQSSKLVINDLTFTNVKAHNEFTGGDGHNAAVIASYTEGDIELNNVHVYKADVKAMEGVGVLIGLVTKGTEVKINNCSVNDSKVSNLAVAKESGYVAAMVGKVAAATVTFTGENAINNTTIEAFYDPERGEQTIDWVAVKRVEEAVITGADAVTVTGGSMTKIALEDIVEVTPENLSTTTFAEDGYYVFKGDFANEVVIKTTSTGEQTFDGSKATFGGHIKFTAKRIADDIGELDDEKSGTYTFKGFKTNNSIAFGSCAVASLNVKECEAYMMYFNISNSVVNVEGNTVVRPASAEDTYKRLDGGNQKDIIQVYADNYTLNLNNNTIKDEKGVGNNVEVYGQANWASHSATVNAITAKGNKISNVNAEMPLVKIYNDVTYAPVNYPEDYTVTEAAKQLAKALKTENTLEGGSCVISVLCRAADQADKNIELTGNE